MAVSDDLPEPDGRGTIPEGEAASSEAASFDGGDEKQVKARNRRLRISERDRGEVLKELMKTAKGRAFVAEMLEPAFITSFHPDPIQMARNCGWQDHALMMLARVTAAAPNDYLLLLKERMNDRERDS